VLVLAAPFILSASDCAGGSSSGPAPLPAPAGQPIYESGDLGTLAVDGAPTEARARFTLGPDELPLAVIVEASYVPSGGNPGPASAELLIFDSKGDQDPANDAMVAGHTPGPYARAVLSSAEAGIFSLRVPLAQACAGSPSLTGGTWAVRLRITGSEWRGTITAWKLRVVTLKGVQIRPEPGSFIRD
jgi:hypothetical protein